MKFETDLVRRVDKIMTTDSAVVGLSWCFNQDSYHFDRVSFTTGFKAQEFTCPLRIRHLEITIKFNPSVEEVEKAKKFFEEIQKSFKQVETVSVIFNC